MTLRQGRAFQRCFLDGRHLSISVRLSAAINLTKAAQGKPSYETFYYYCQRILTCIAFVRAREITATKRPEGKGQLRHRYEYRIEPEPAEGRYQFRPARRRHKRRYRW